MLALRVADIDYEKICGGVTLDEVADDLASAYERHATEQGWELTESIRVLIRLDPTLRSGWIPPARMTTTLPAYTDGDSARCGATEVAHPKVKRHQEISQTVHELGVEATVRYQAFLTIASEGTVLGLTNERSIIGRGQGCVIHLPDPIVSTEHAAITTDGDTWWITDLMSRNGTYLNGGPVKKRTRLEEGDVIRIGRTGPNLRFAHSRVDKMEAQSAHR